MTCYSTPINLKVFLFHWAELRSAGPHSYTHFQKKLRTKDAESAGKKNIFLNRKYRSYQNLPLQGLQET